MICPPRAAADFTFDFKWGANFADGSSGSGNGEFLLPTDVVYANGNVYVSDLGNNRIQRFTFDGAYLQRWGAGGGSGAPGTGDGEFSSPFGISTDGQGNVYVADADNNRVQKFGPLGQFIARWGANGGNGSSGVGDAEFSNPFSVAVDPSSGHVYVADTGNSRIQRLDASGKYVAQFPMQMPGDVFPGTPAGIAVGATGDVYVSDLSYQRVAKFNAAGQPLGQWGKPGSAPGELSSPFEVDVDGDGNVFVADFGNDRVQQFDSSGKHLYSLGSSGKAAGQFSGPTGVAAGLPGRLYVADRGNNRAQSFVEAPPPDEPDVTPPQITDLRASTVRHKRGSSFTYRLSEDATVTFTISKRKLAFGKACGKSSKLRGKHHRHHHAPWFCMPLSPLANLTTEGKQGDNTYLFSGRLGGVRLRPGTYRLSAVATDAAGNESDPAKTLLIVLG
ncbi:MAG: hypothetical protein WDZ37_02120 [Solirubrobacterales bacterium]